MLISKFRLFVKAEWLGSLSYNGEECEVFIQEGVNPQVFVVPTLELSNRDLTNVGTVFDYCISSKELNE